MRLHDDSERMRFVCLSCGAVGYGNATCRDCVSQWPRFGIPQEAVDGILAAIGDRSPDPPFGTVLE
jgi:hypothetical protein